MALQTSDPRPILLPRRDSMSFCRVGPPERIVHSRPVAIPSRDMLLKSNHCEPWDGFSSSAPTFSSPRDDRDVHSMPDPLGPLMVGNTSPSSQDTLHRKASPSPSDHSVDPLVSVATQTCSQPQDTFLAQRVSDWEKEYSNTFAKLHEIVMASRDQGQSHISVQLYKTQTHGSKYEREWRNRLSIVVYEAIVDFMTWAEHQGFAVALTDKWDGVKYYHGLYGESWGELVVHFHLSFEDDPEISS